MRVMGPSEHVLDMFAVPGDVEAVPGGQVGSVRAGDLVLSPGRDPLTLESLNPVLARLAATLDTRPGRDRRDLRIAMPVPARDGSWVIEGWGASRFEPGARLLTDLPATRAVGAILHAELASVVTHWPAALHEPRDQGARAERQAFGADPVVGDAAGAAAALLRTLSAERDDTPIGPDSLVHGSLMGHVLLDPDGAPVVIDVAPYWRPPLWAEATCVLDAVLWWNAHPEVIAQWRAGPPRQAMVRSAIFRLLNDTAPAVGAYERALAPLLDAQESS